MAEKKSKTDFNFNEKDITPTKSRANNSVAILSVCLIFRVRQDFNADTHSI